MAISKERKNEVVKQYVEWVNSSHAVVVTEYTGLTMKQLDDLRTRVRDAGGEFHVVKNTLGEVAFKEAGLPTPGQYLQGSTAVAFAFEDAPSIAKAISEFARTSDFLKVKGGYLDKVAIRPQDVQALADLPPLPILRAKLLGTLLAPASQLVRVLAEPGRQVAAVVKAYADREGAQAPAEAAA